MNYRDKSKTALIKELQKLQKEYDSLKTIYENDITERKQVDKELHLSSEIMKNLTEGINMIRCIDEIIVFTNQKFDEMFGYEQGELNGKNVSILNAPGGKSPEEIKRDIIDTIYSTDEWHGEILNINKTGKHFWCYVNIAVFDHPEYGKVYLSVHSDITQRKHAENEIKKNEHLRNVLLDNLPLITLVLKKNTREIVAANKLAFEAGAVIGKTCYETLTHCTHSCPFCKAPDLWETGKFQQIEAKYIGRYWEGRWVPFSEDLYVHYILDITGRKMSERKIRKSKKLLEALNRHLIEVRENERSQIAMNLHDDIGQKLTALNFNITWIKSRIGVQSRAVKEKLEELSLTINQTIEGIQDFSSNLRPEILYDLGPISAFDSFLKKFEKQCGIKCHFYHYPEQFKIEDHIALIIYRIFQESMTNIARHSEATVAEVTLRQVKNKIEMLIKDNGIGIDEEKVDALTSMGIAGIKERVRSVKGNVLIKGEKGSWTFIKVSIPFKTVKIDD